MLLQEDVHIKSINLSAARCSRDNGVEGTAGLNLLIYENMKIQGWTCVSAK